VLEPGKPWTETEQAMNVDLEPEVSKALEHVVSEIHEAFVPLSLRTTQFPLARKPDLHLELLDDLRHIAVQAVAELRQRELAHRPGQGVKVEELIGQERREIYFDELAQYIAAGPLARAAHPAVCTVAACDDLYQQNETDFAKTYTGLRDPIVRRLSELADYVGGKRTRASEMLKNLQRVMDTANEDERRIYLAARDRLPAELAVDAKYLTETLEREFARIGITKGYLGVYRYLLCYLTMSDDEKRAMYRVGKALELLPPPEIIVRQVTKELDDAERFDGFANIWERKTALRIAEMLEPRGWTVFVQPIWVVPDEGRGRVVYYDPDFVLVHPDLGIYVLEEKQTSRSVVELTKGSYANSSRRPYRWSDPALQAQRKHSGLLNAMQESDSWSRSWNPFADPEGFPVYWGCMFPNAYELRRSNFGHPRERFILASDMVDGASLHESLRRIREVSTGGRSIGAIDNKLFACLGEVIREEEPEPAMRVAAAATADETPPLDLRQLELLHAAEVSPSVSVVGPAGSGKSVLALGVAKRWADRGRSVLYVCYNNLLAGEVLRDVRESGYGGRVEVRTYFDLAKHEAELAGIYPRTPVGRVENWDELDRIGQRAMNAAQPRFDAVVVDESQDFKRAWIEAVSSLVREDAGGKRRWMFGDPFQALNVDAATSTSEFSTGTIELPYNHRNPKPIHEAASRLRPEGATLECRRGHGLDVSYFAAQEVYLPARLFEAIHRLVGNGARLDEIVILTCTTTKGNPLFLRGEVEKSGMKYLFGNPAIDPKTGDRLGLSADRVPRLPDDAILFESVNRFKGLDAEFVILVDPPMPDPDQVLTLRTLYVGMTRARTHLTLVGTSEIVEAVRAFGVKPSHAV
jgi:hypothetical protein